VTPQDHLDAVLDRPQQPGLGKRVRHQHDAQPVDSGQPAQSHHGGLVGGLHEQDGDRAGMCVRLLDEFQLRMPPQLAYRAEVRNRIRRLDGDENAC
jgi:hypothetical protein